MQMPEPAVSEQVFSHDLQPLLDQELSRLPDKYRVAIVLCDLEGKTRKEAARQLGCPEGTLAGRLMRGRTMLAKRLGRHGLALSGGALAVVLSQQAVSAGVPSVVISSTIKAASKFAAGQAAGAGAGAISVKVATLTEGVLKAMLLTKLKVAFAIVLVLGFVATEAGILTRHTAAAQSDKLPAMVEQVNAQQKQQSEKEKEPFTVWGKAVNGLQAGLGFRPGEQGVRHAWGMVTLVVRVRNVSMKEVTFQYCPETDWTRLPDVTDAKGKPIAITGGFLPNFCSWKKVNLAPGKSIDLWQWKLNLRPESERTKPPPDNPPYATLYGPGKFIIRYPWVSAWQLEWRPPNAWAKLGTGKLELEIKADPPQKQEQKQPQEGFTAWSKEVGGLHTGQTRNLDRVDTILQRWHEQMEKIQGLTCQFQKTDVDRVYQSSQTFDGTLRYMKPDWLMLEIRKKDRKEIDQKVVYDGQVLSVYYGDQKVIRRYPEPSQAYDKLKVELNGNFLGRIMQAIKSYLEAHRLLFFCNDVEEIKRRYRIEFRKEDEWYIYLLVVPRTDQNAFARAQVVLHKSTFLPRQLWFEECNGNERTWDFFRLDPAARLNRADFTVTLPPGWRTEGPPQ